MNSANDDYYGKPHAQTIAHIKVIPAETREHPLGVAILAVLGLVVGCLVGSVL